MIRGSVGRAYGTPFWSRGRGIGDSTTLDPSVLLPDAGATITNPVGAFGFPTSGPPSWLPAATQLGQTAFSDVFSVLKLYNPLPPGVVMQSGPGGTYMANYGSGANAAYSGGGAFPGMPMELGSFLPILLIGGVVLLIFARGK